MEMKRKKKRSISNISCMILFIALILLPVHNASTETKLSAIELYQLKERCGKTCSERFKEEYGKEGPYSYEGNKGLIAYSSHYNAKLNKCFILITDARYSDEGYQSDVLWDIIENKVYGDYFAFRRDKKSFNMTITKCGVLGVSCKSKREWDTLVKPYMEE